MITAQFDGTYEGWRSKARTLLAANVFPAEVLWTTGNSLFDDDGSQPPALRTMNVPKDLVQLAERVGCHRDERRWALLYRLLYRVVNGERALLQIVSDPDVKTAFDMEHQVRHDLHRMHAFVRFRLVSGSTPERYVAWHKPDHLILRKAGPWFANRFGSMHWSILTPDGSAHWDTHELTYGPGVARSEAPQGDELEELWRAYYGSIFNPARLNPELMRQHMPARYWPSMPEAGVINELVAGAAAKQWQMIGQQSLSGGSFIPPDATLPVLREAVKSCRGCELFECATQPVFGEGPPDARVVLVGEQPGDQEDVQGRPFVGPAGQLLDRALREAGLDRGSVYFTNAVKHFRYEERGKRRIHKTASKAQVSACQPWVEKEIELLRPNIIVCLGKTAALSIVGRDVALHQMRGQVLPHRSGGKVVVTVHPSFLLRVPDASLQAAEYRRFVEDLRVATNLANAA